MEVGINLPWIGYGWDFGGPSNYGRTSPDWRTELITHLRDFQGAGITVVRWFIFGDGFVLGTHGNAPRLVSDRWRFDNCPRLHQAALEDWQRALEIFREAGLKLLPSVIDFKAAAVGVAASGARGYVKAGRADLFRSRGTRQFISNVLRPMIEVADDYRDEIYAWEIINEPEWVVEADNNVTIANMQNFLSDCHDTISYSHFRTTIGFVRESTLYDWAPFDRAGGGSSWPHTHIRPGAQRRRYRRLTTSITIPPSFVPQFHYYTHSRSRGLPDTLPQPLILGEFATRTGFDTWPDLSAGQGTMERLQHLDREGVTLAIPWSYPVFNDSDSATSESWPNLRRQIDNFTP